MTEIREEGLTPRKVSRKIKEKLLFANVITEELGIAWRSNGLKGKHVLKNLVNGEIIKKYKSFSLIFLETFRGVKPSSLISVIVLFLGVKTTGVDVLGVFSTEGDVLGMLSLGCVFLTMLTSR
jgi:hypothetical protein